ncbi:MAG: hypothetical protein QOG68_1703, partial [Solirubrobacteraceae bacterium]|nr:hypothetical protein [Solirubrobacteraceae bacterium]
MSAAVATVEGLGNQRAPWKAAVAKYAQPSLARTTLDIVTSVVPYLGLMVAMYYLLDVSILLTLALAPLAAGFLLRSFILFHDCTHGSLFRSKRMNRWFGTFAGLLVYTPFESWGHSHAVHHATAGDLDRRGVGDVQTLTVEEYLSRNARGRLVYRLFRNPAVMFGLGPILSVVVVPRLIPKNARPRLRRAVMRTNVAVAVMVTGLVFAMGWWQYLIVQWPAAWMAASTGIWLFYVQHQFEDTYWECNEKWEYADAAIRGSSFLKLPRIL